jgi:hypothetical protein
MIEHVVLFKLKPEITGEEKNQLILRLEKLARQVEGIVRLKVGQDILHTEDSFDLGLFVTLADQAGLQRYGESESRRATSAYARSLCEQVVLFDYEAGAQEV